MRDAIIKLPTTVDCKWGRAPSKNADPARVDPNIAAFLNIVILCQKTNLVLE